MAEVPDTDRKYEAPSAKNHHERAQTRHIDRRELRVLCGIIMSLVGMALLFATLIAGFQSYSSYGRFFILAAALIAAGLMFVGSGMTGKALGIGQALFVAVPGGFLAAAGYITGKFFQPYLFSEAFDFEWKALFFLGLLWVILGPIFVYRVRTRLWNTISPDTDEDHIEEKSKGGSPERGLAIATWSLFLVTLLDVLVKVFRHLCFA